VDEGAQLAAGEETAAPPAYPHPGMEARGLVDELLEVRPARPGRGHDRPAAHARDAGHRDARALQAQQHPRVRGRVRAAAAQRDVEAGGRLLLAGGGFVGRAHRTTAPAGAWISCRLTMSRARSRRAWTAFTV